MLLFHSRVLGSDAPTLQNAITFIEMNQNEDGGWGYWVGHDSYTEPTGLCLLALRYAGRDHGIGKGLNYLERCQLVSNGIGINTDDREGSWMSYAALLAFHAFGASKEEICLREWILNFYDGYNNTPPDVVESMYQEFRYDMSIDGWPWFAHTNSWIEPTSFFVIALTYSGVETTNQRIRSGLQLLMDRTNKSGGWNYGNPFVKHTYLDAYPLPTSIALLAMGVAGYTEEEPVLERAIAFLDQFTGEEMSIASLAWTLLAFNHYQTTKEKAETIAIVLKKRQLPDGSFRGNLFETALSFLALSGFNFNTDAIRFRK
ncbi:MAG: hypothetical protein JW840_08645 [Candidatus Thermoplasmatota archaeon]|nr:hypothetical protein [Candidatus Thermoplasmatota archaeon]